MFKKTAAVSRDDLFEMLEVMKKWPVWKGWRGGYEVPYQGKKVEVWVDDNDLFYLDVDGKEEVFETPEEVLNELDTMMKTKKAEMVQEPRGYNIPKPDVFVPKIDDEGKPLVPLYPDLIGYDIDPYEASALAEMAQAFYESYQHIRTNIAPQHVVPLHSNMEVAEYSIIFASENGLSNREMAVLWEYMCAIGMFPHSEHDAWRQHVRMNALLPTQHDDLAG